MFKLVLVSLLGLSLAVSVLEGKALTLESGKVLYLKSVDSTELKYVESVLGCSTKCASACVSFASGLSAVECTNHCGCSSLISTKPGSLSAQNLVDGDISIDVYYPMSSSDSSVIVADVEGETVKVTVDDNSYPEYGYYEVSAAVNTEDGSASSDEVVIVDSVAVGDGYEYSYTSVTGADGSSVAVTGYSSESSDANSTSTYDYVGVTTTDSYGNSTTDYVDYSTYETYGENNGTLTEVVTATVDDVSYAEVVYSEYEVDATGQGYGESYGAFQWWVNTQQTVIGSIPGIYYIEMVSALTVVACLVFLAYTKYAQVKTQRYQLTVRPVENATGYIRI